MAQFQLDTVLPCSYEAAVAEVKTPRLFMHVSSPVLVFEPTNGTVVPNTWEGRTYWFRLKLFGFLPLGAQAIDITVTEEPDTLKIQDNGHSRLIRVWNHLITIQRKNGDTFYRDTLNVDAGVLTPLVWLFARLLFAHRQKRWRQLALSGFKYDKE